jgi:hypothetical protein
LFVWWCVQQYFSYIMAVSFYIGGGSRGSRRKPQIVQILFYFRFWLISNFRKLGKTRTYNQRDKCTRVQVTYFVRSINIYLPLSFADLKGWFFFQLFNWFQLFVLWTKNPKVAGHSQNLSNLTFLKRGVDGFSVIFHIIPSDLYKHCVIYLADNFIIDQIFTFDKKNNILILCKA